MIQKWIWNLKCMLNLSWVEFDLNLSWLICACEHIWFDQQQHPMISELTGTWIRMGCEAIMTINDYLKQRWYHAEKNSWIKVAQEGKYRNRALRIGVAAGEATIEYANFDGDFGPSECPQKRSTRDGGGATCPEPPATIAGLTPSAPGLCVHV